MSKGRVIQEWFCRVVARVYSCHKHHLRLKLRYWKSYPAFREAICWEEVNYDGLRAAVSRKKISENWHSHKSYLLSDIRRELT